MPLASAATTRLCALLAAYRCGEDIDSRSVGGRATPAGLEAEAKELRRIIDALGDFCRDALAELAAQGAEECDPGQADVIAEACTEALVTPLESQADDLRRFPDDGSDDAYEAARDREAV